MKKIMDGNDAAAYCSFLFTDVAALYPITPSSSMAEQVEKWAAKGKKNIFHQSVKIVPMHSEAEVSGAMHGFLKSGALATAYTSSQGLLLMVPTLYKLVGELLPAVIHVSSRSIATSALSIYGDHSDVMAARQTGAVMLASGNVQEVALFATAAHIAAIKGRLPILHFFDGFQTSHELRKIKIPSPEKLANYVDYEMLDAFRNNSLSNFSPKLYGSSQTPDIFFQQREASNLIHLNMESIIRQIIHQLNSLFGTRCSLVNYEGLEDAEYVIIAMGSVQETITQVMIEQNALGKKYGFISVHLYRPFPAKTLLRALPEAIKKIAVLDKTKEPGSVGEPLLLDVQRACAELENSVDIIGGRYGLGSKEITPAHIRSVYRELERKQPKQRFTIGITDDVTRLSLNHYGKNDLTSEETFQAKIWGFASDGAVSGAKLLLKTIGEETVKDIQGQFYYSSSKARNLTLSYLRIADEKIQSAYSVKTSNMVVCNKAQFLNQYDVLEGLKDDGIFLLNTSWGEDAIENKLPQHVKKYILDHNINFYIIDANKLTRQYDLGPFINTIMMTVTLDLTDFLEYQQAKMTYQKLLSEELLANHHDYRLDTFSAMDEAISWVQKVKLKGYDNKINENTLPVQAKTLFEEKILLPIKYLQGDQITTKDIIEAGMMDGSFPLGTSSNQPIACPEELPKWNPKDCIQCNLCSIICPQGAIRPFVLNDEENAKKPQGMLTAINQKNEKELYRVQVNPNFCTGCSLCESICPLENKALQMVKTDETKFKRETQYWDFSALLKNKEEIETPRNVRESQLKQPLLEFSSACSGCGETPYIKLLTQLFGNQVAIANATGCSSIWGGQMPFIPYTVNQEKEGPIWANSLFENNASFGMGMQVGNHVIKRRLRELIRREASNPAYSRQLKTEFKKWLEEDSDKQRQFERSKKLMATLDNERKNNEVLEYIYQKKHYLIDRSQWLIGGDGWAYDIDFAGIDNLLSTGEDVNILILDNEGYANTGGQISQASPKGSNIKLATNGKKQAKKDIGMFAIQYEDVYVAQVCLSANPQQMIHALTEAEQFSGSSIIIAYSPCVIHGNKDNMLIEGRKATECGYWPLYRYNPSLLQQGKNPMKLDSKQPKWELFRDFLMTQKRFTKKENIKSNEASCLLRENEVDARKRYFRYKMIREMYQLTTN